MSKKRLCRSHLFLTVVVSVKKVTLLFLIQSSPTLLFSCEICNFSPKNPLQKYSCVVNAVSCRLSRVNTILLSSLSLTVSLSLTQADRERSARGGYRRLGDAWRSQRSLFCIDRSVGWRSPVVGEKFGYVNLLHLTLLLPPFHSFGYLSSHKN